MRPSSPNPYGRCRLILASVAIGCIWMILLPWLASQPKMARQLQWLSDRKIDPSAMYYTELEVLDPILDRMNAASRRQPQ